MTNRRSSIVQQPGASLIIGQFK